MPKRTAPDHSTECTKNGQLAKTGQACRTYGKSPESTCLPNLRVAIQRNQSHFGQVRES
ncbi:MAG: hypothetical protein Q8M16_04665 [Pirellulaceae bacterium]|nr:hypothetical protein [Pirellulaceae bacterium]